MDKDFAKQIILKLSESKILDYDFWISKELDGDCCDGSVDDVIEIVKDLINEECTLARSGNYCAIYDEGTEDENGDKVYIFKDYIELTIPRRNKELN